MQPRSLALATALAVAVLYSTYGLAEQVLAWHAPALWGHDTEFGWGPWVFGLLLAPLYTLLAAGGGALLGLLAAHFLGRHVDPSSTPRSLAVLGLAFECTLVTFEARHAAGGKALLLIAAGLLGLALAALLVPRAARQLTFALRAPSAAALVLLPGWVLAALPDRPAGAAAHLLPLLVALGVLAVAYGLRRVAPGPLGARTVLAHAAAWGLLLGGGWLRLERPDDLLAPVRAAAPQGAGPRLVLLVVLDTVRADHLSLYGYERETTPHLEELAGRALVFDRAMSPGDMTLSSHASMFTGLHARTHGAHFDANGTGRPLAPAFTTLAEHLEAAGWATVGVAANHVFFGRGYGLEQGFEAFDAHESAEYQLLHVAGRMMGHTLGRWLHGRLAATAPERADLRHYRAAEGVVDQALAVIDAAAEGPGSTFLFVNLMDAHWPYVPPAPFDERFAGRDERFEYPAWRHDMVREVLREESREVSEAERAHMLSQYDGAIAYMDAQVGRLIERLDELELFEDTLLIVTSDHGEAFGEHGLVGHAVSVHQDQVHVPLIVSASGSAAGSRTGLPASLVDLPRTLLTATGLEARLDVLGRDLLAPPLDVDPLPRTLAESFPNPALGGERLARTQRALRYVQPGAQFVELKIIRTTGAPDRLFDLGEDPAELRDLTPASPYYREVAEALDAFLENVPEAEAGAALDDRAALERLRRLGY